MENAGRSAAEFIYTLKPKSVAIFVGSGKNGGDGLVCARHLLNRGIKVYLFLMSKKMAEETNINFNIIKSMGVKYRFITWKEDIATLLKKRNPQFIIDALLGIGLKGDVSKDYMEIIEIINRSGIRTISIDIPSGLDCDSGKICGTCIKADFTLTMGFLKKCFLNKEARKYTGKVILMDVGYPQKLIKFL